MSSRSTYIDDLAKKIRSAMPSELVPDEPDVDDLFRIYALIGRVRGRAVSAKDVHDAWSTWMASRGQNHESLVPYAKLSPEVRAKDQPFVDAIRKAVS